MSLSRHAITVVATAFGLMVMFVVNIIIYACTTILTSSRVLFPYVSPMGA